MLTTTTKKNDNRNSSTCGARKDDNMQVNNNNASRATTCCAFGRCLQSTRVIPADVNVFYGGICFLARIKQFAKHFEAETFFIMKHEYEKAFEGNKTDENGWHRGVRLITGERYEVKVLGSFMVDYYQEFPKQLVQYTEQQAVRDQRVAKFSTNERSFSEWSMIVANGKVGAQVIHIDVPESNFQFGMVLTKGVPGTHVLIQEDFGPYNINQLLNEIWSDAPQSLVECLLPNHENNNIH